MIKSEGRKRVVITNVQPSVEDGRFAAKAIQFQPTEISADVFADGHDELIVRLFIRPSGERAWKVHDMVFRTNDKWSIQFEPAHLGCYQFRVCGMIDHFSTWKKSVAKKHEAGQDISVELQNGVQLVRQKAASLKGASAKALTEWANRLESEIADVEQALNIANEDLVQEIMSRFDAAANLITESKVYTLDVDRKRASFSTWYELFPRSAGEHGKHGTFKDVVALLPRIQRMGFDVLYLPPIHPIGEEKRKGRNNSLTAQDGDPGSPWAIGNKNGGHKSVHPELGTLSDFKTLVRKASQAGIELAMDIALQCAPDHPYVKQHPEWFKWRADGTVQYAENPPKKYEDILPFDFETEAWESLWEELKSIFLFWIDKGVKIFRVDNPHTKSFYFWEWAIKEIRTAHPEVLFLAEAFTRPRLMDRLAKAGFSQSYTYFTWRNTKHELEEYLTELTTSPVVNFFRPNFWPNTPDILPPALTHGGEPAHIIRLILAATLSPSYGIYGPVYEFGLREPMPGKEEYIDNEKYEIKTWDWSAYTKIKEVITRVNRLRKTYTALQELSNIQFLKTTNDNIIAYLKSAPNKENSLLIVVNIDPYNTQSGMVQVPETIAQRGAPLGVSDLLSGDRYTWSAGENYVSLNPNDLPAHIFLLQ